MRSFAKFSHLLLLSVPLALASGLSAQYAAGTTASESQVNESGAATYSVPIVVSPGTNKLQPNLKIAYNSQGRSGPLGIGWGLTGLAAITRSSATLDQDGRVDGVDYDSLDRFNLDGERLVNIRGSYGANGTEYRTEQETFTKVLSYGRQGNGPAWFRAWTQAGLILDFGSTGDSRIEAPGRIDVLSWRLSRVADRQGNYMNVRYYEDRARGESVPTRIDYGGNSVARTAHYASVRFEYAVRPDQLEAYMQGGRFTSYRRMTRVRSYYGTAQVRRYDLVYGTSGPARDSRLVSIQEFGSDNSALEPIRFTWGSAGAETSTMRYGVASFAPRAGGWGREHPRMPADVNGDGRSDIVGFANAGVYVSISNGSTYAAPRRFITGYGYSSGWRVGSHERTMADVNGDGRADVVGFAHSGVYVALSNGSAFTGSRRWLAYYGYSHGWRVDRHPRIVQDVNGDGRADIVGFAGHGTVVSYSTGSGFTAPRTVVSYFGYNQGWRTNHHPRYVTDVNGDGLADIVGFAGHGTVVSLSTGSGFSAAQTWIRAFGYSAGGWRVDKHPRYMADANGDGMADIIGFGHHGVDVSLSTGRSFAAPRRWTGQYSFGYGQNWRTQYHPRLVADMNGDGRADIVGIGNFGVAASLSTGKSFAHARTWSRNMGYDHGWRVGTHHRMVADTDGDGRSDILGFANSAAYSLTSNVGDENNRITRITHGGRDLRFQYRSLTNNAVYRSYGTDTYPNVSFRAPVYVVYQAQSSTGQTATSLATMRYFYEGAVLNLRGRGFRGFKRVTVSNLTTGIKETTLYARDHGCIAARVRQVQRRLISNNRLLTLTDNTIACRRTYGGRVNFSYASRTITRGYELNGAMVSVSTVSRGFDTYGNLTAQTTSYTGGHTKSESYAYYNNASTWVVGQLTRKTVTERRYRQPARTKTSEFRYNASYTRLVSEIREPRGAANIRRELRLAYDRFGNVVTSSMYGHDGARTTSRTTRKTYDARGRFVTAVTNPLGFVTRTTYEPRLGMPLVQIDANGNNTTSTYDGFGRKTAKTIPGLGTTRIRYIRYRTSVYSYYVISDKAGSPSTIKYYDILDRERLSRVRSFNGRYMNKLTLYNARGQAYAVSDPYLDGERAQYTYLYYDAIGRVIDQREPGGRRLRKVYSGFTTTAINTRGQRLVEVQNVFGDVVQTTDALGNRTSYVHDSSGNLVSAVSPNGSRRAMTYDIVDRKIRMVDPDLGTTTYAHNAFDELTSERNARGYLVRFTYDAMGRKLTRSEAEGLTRYEYDRGTGSRGQLYRVTGVRGHSETNAYDRYGRLVATTYSSPGASFVVRNAYDGYGRLYMITYPTGIRVRYNYNAYGYLTEARDGATNALYWRANARDSLGKLTSETFGNGRSTSYGYHASLRTLSRIYTPGVRDLRYSFDALGNLTARTDAVRGRGETFAYDAINRLVSSRVTGRGAITYRYDRAGNLTYRSDVGTYRYGTTTVRPHAVTRIDRPGGGILKSLTYDASGNAVRNGTASISYTSYNKPWRVSTSSGRTDFEYGPNRDRKTQRVYDGARVRETRHYVGALYERVQRGSAFEHIHYIRVENRVVAVKRTGSTNSLRYLHRDHLGSVQAVTDEAGRVKEVLSYDAFGKRRSASTWGPANIRASEIRGFGGHEHLEIGHLASLGLVHMNGRVYDANIGRFLSADPFVQKGGAGQNFNRYSFGLNNPLSFVDPSGFFFKKLFKKIGKFFKKIWKPLVAIVVGAITGGWALGFFGLSGMTLGGAIVSGMVGGFAASTTGALLNGASLGDALKAGLRGAVIGAVTGGIMHGIRVGLRAALDKFIAKDAQLYKVTKIGDNTYTVTKADAIVGPRLYVNGIQSPLENAVRQGIELFGDSFTLAHNPTNGIFKDLLESTMGKLLGPSGEAVQISQWLKNASGLKQIVAHSQGGILMNNALGLLARDGVSLAGVQVTYIGAAVHQGAALGAVKSVNAIWNGFYAHPADLVPNITGLNANPVTLFRSIFEVKNLISNHSTYYYSRFTGGTPGTAATARLLWFLP